ncbi:MAG: class I SAM-dependent methyltransferase [Candidatus Deferrimicrobiaceae bacterium]
MPKTCFTPCILCGRDAPQPVAVQKGYPIVRCGGCGLVYVHPKPSEEDLPGLYGEYHARDGGNEAGWNRLMEKVFREAADHLDRFRNGDGPPRLLDVGCGYGGFVSLMRDRGWDAEGVDPSPRTVSAASVKGIPVRLGTLDAFSRSGAAYRAITMFYVMEHLFDPMSSLKKVFSLLEPGGVLLVRVPDTTPIVRLLSPFGLGDGLYDPPFHLFDFPPRVLARMLTEAGFGQIRTFPGRNTIPLRIGPRWATMLFGALARGLFAGSGGRVLLPGTSKTTIARKPS